jgi:hypothetical protein
VEGSLTRSRDIHAGNEWTGSMVAGRDVVLDGTHVNGHVSAGRGIYGHSCMVEGNLSAGRDVKLDGCSGIHNISAGRGISLLNTSVSQDVHARQSIYMADTRVKGNVSVSGNAELLRSVVGKTLSVATDYLKIEDSTVGDIQVHDSARSSGYSIVGSNNIVAHGSSVVTNRKGHISITVGSNSVSSMNGYTVKGRPGETTVWTPGGGIYMNGRKVSGPGAETYREYQSQEASAPAISGPGWRDLPDLPEKSPPATDISIGETPSQVVELMENTTVKGDIVFEGARGQVILHPGTHLHGKVKGGVSKSGL